MTQPNADKLKGCDEPCRCCFGSGQRTTCVTHDEPCGNCKGVGVITRPAPSVGDDVVVAMVLKAHGFTCDLEMAKTNESWPDFISDMQAALTAAEAMGFHLVKKD